MRFKVVKEYLAVQKTWTWSTTSFTFAHKTHEEIQEIFRFAGLSGIEGSARTFEGASDEQLEVLGRQYASAGVKVETFHLPFRGQDDLASFYESIRRQAVETARIWIERSARLGACVGIQHPTTSTFDVSVEGLDRYLGQLGKSLAVLLPWAESFGYAIAIENMLPADGGRFCSQPEHLERIVKEFDHPHLGFCLDTGHALCAMGPQRADEIFDVMAARLVALHLADNAGDRDSHLAPGHGLVDWDRVFRRAAELKFSAAVCIETPPFAPGPDYSAESVRQMVQDTDVLVDRALG